MILQSLKFRLLAGAAVGIALALIAAGFFIVQSFALSLERERLTHLDATLKRLVAEIDPDAENPLSGDLPTDPRYETPLSGVYWQVEDLSRGKIYRSRSLWDGKLVFDATATGEPRLRQVAGPGDQTLLLLSRIVNVEGRDGTRAFRVSVAEARDDPNHPVRSFGNDLTIALTIVALFLFGAAWLQVVLGLRPLRKLRSDVEAVRQGDSERLPEDYASELQPVVAAVNNLLG